MIGEIGNFKMKKLLLILLFFPMIGLAQDKRYSIKNIKVNDINELLEIKYDISSIPSTYFNISLNKSLNSQLSIANYTYHSMLCIHGENLDKCQSLF